MNNKNVLITIVVAIVILIIGYLFIESNDWLRYESAILYFTAIIGAGCYWIGSNHGKNG